MALLQRPAALPALNVRRCRCLWPVELSHCLHDHPRPGRVACAAEREVLVGFRSGHTRCSNKGHAEGLRCVVSLAEERVRCSLLGNSFHTLAGSTLFGVLLTAHVFLHLCVPPRLLHERFIDEVPEYVRTGGDRIVDELVTLEEAVVDKGAVPGDAIGQDGCSGDELLLLDWLRLFPNNVRPSAPGGTALSWH